MKKLAVFLFVLAFTGFAFLSGCKALDDDPLTPQEKAGDTLWIHTVPEGANTLWIAELPLAIGKDGTIYYTASGGQANWEASRVYAVNKTDGSIKWISEPLELWHVNSNIVVGDDGTVYVMSYTKLYSIEPGSGTFNWIWEVPQNLPLEGNDVYTYGEVSSLALADNGDLIFKTSGSGTYYRALYCVGTDGSMKWYRFIQASGNPITVGHNGVIYDYSGINGVYYIMATDPGTGSVLWNTKAYTSYDATNISITDNGDLIAFVANDSVARIDPADGTFLWKAQVTGSSSHRVLIDNNGLINLLNVYEASVYRYSSHDGLQSGEALPNGLSCLDNSGKMYYAGNNGVQVTRYDGELAWTFNAATYGKSLTISSDNIVYAASNDKVYAIRGDGSMATSGWPAYAHDNRNTFNAGKP